MYCYDRNGYGIWHLPNNVSADLACVTDGTNIVNKGSFVNWRDSQTIFGGSESNDTLLNLVVDVMLGKYGTGTERKQKLGSKYTEVQNMINHIYSATTETLVSEVMQGFYGNGDTRKIALGSRYNEVQSVINSLY